MIEPRGAKHAYCYMVKAIHVRPHVHTHNHTMVLDVADSDDEATGRAMRIAQLYYPSENGWNYHHVAIQRISGIECLGPHKVDRIEAVPCPR